MLNIGEKYVKNIKKFKCKNMANLVTIKTRISTSGLRSQVG